MPTINDNKFQQAALGSDVGLLQTSDGVKMLDLWLKVINPGLEKYNAVLNLLSQFMAYRTDLTQEEVIQTVGSKWQKNTEITKGTGSVKIRGFWVRTAANEYKKYMGWTRKFIKEHSAAHIVQHLNAELKGLTDQKFSEILSAFFTKGERDVLDPMTHEALKIQCLVDGTGNMPIPRVGTNVFDSTHSHFDFVDSSTTAWSVVATREARLKSLIRLVREHGYFDNLVIMVNSNMSDEIAACPSYRPFVATSPFGQSDNSALAGTDTQATMLTFRPMAGLFRVIGTLPLATVIESDVLPNRYVACFSYQGPNSPDNPVQWLEQPVQSFSENPYPFYETILETAFGASIRKRLNGAVLYADAAANAYVTPTVLGAGAIVGDWDGN